MRPWWCAVGALVGCGVMAACCATTADSVRSHVGTASDSDGLRATVVLQVEGLALEADEPPRDARWEGRGVWIDETHLLTSARTATRARHIVGVGADGAAYAFDTIVALDRASDTAVLTSDRPGPPGLAAGMAPSGTDAILESARARKGVLLAALFRRENVAPLAEIWGRRAFCVGPGEGFTVAFEAPGATDVLALVKATDAASELHAALLQGAERVLWRGVLRGERYLPFTLAAGGPYHLVVMSPPTLTERVCGEIGAGEIAWENGIR
jgi:hypothetical protein